MFKIYPTDFAKIESAADQLEVGSQWKKFPTPQGFQYQVEAIEFCNDLVIRFMDHRDVIVFSLAIEHY